MDEAILNFQDITWEAFMLHNGQDVDPVVLQNVLMRFSTC